MPQLLTSLLKKTVPMSVIRRTQRILSWERSLNLEWTVNSGLHLRVGDGSDWMVYNDIFVDGEYDVPINDLLEHRDRPLLRVLDLGANVGFFTLRLFDQCRRSGLPDTTLHVTMVEGSPTNARTLSERIDESGLHPARVTLVNGLVGERSGSGSMTQHWSSGMSNILSGDVLATPVPFVDLTALLKDEDVIDLLKCDIEGSEHVFLKNYPELLQRVDRAVFEMHPLLCDVEACKKLIHQSGLQYSRVLRTSDEFEVVYFWR